MFELAAVALFVAMILVLYRLFAGPTLYDRVLAVNLNGPFHCTQAAAPLMLETGGGSVVQADKATVDSASSIGLDGSRF